MLSDLRARKLRTIQTRHRRGSLYIAVMAVSLIVSMMMMTALHIAHLKLRVGRSASDRHKATLLASSAIENAMMVLHSDASWRTNLQSGIEYPATPVGLGGGAFTWKLVDRDGDLLDDLSDSVLLQGIGRVGKATYVQQVILQPAGTGLSCLEVAAHAGGDIVLQAFKLTSNQTISANGNITTTSQSTVNSNVEAAVNVLGTGIINGNTVTGITPRAMPEAGVFDYYLANGTIIDVNDLPTWSGIPDLKHTLLSPSNNPFGTGETNPEGIYIIDLGGQSLYIQECRIVGTLVLLNAATAEVYWNMHWEPAVPNYPALLVQGNIRAEFSDSLLLEGPQMGNLNPPGTPYLGLADTDTSDKYPTLMKGLVYATNNITVDWESPHFHGPVVAGGNFNLFRNNSKGVIEATFFYNRIYFENPPPGFADGSTMRAVQRSCKHADSP